MHDNELSPLPNVPCETPRNGKLPDSGIRKTKKGFSGVIRRLAITQAENGVRHVALDIGKQHFEFNSPDELPAWFKDGARVYYDGATNQFEFVEQVD